MRDAMNRIRAGALWAEMSLPEVLLWRGLKARKLGWRFRRQHPMGPYVLDFYCPELRLCVEVDGDSHEFRREADARRDAWLAGQGVRTMRLGARAVLADVELVLERLAATLPPPSAPPTPPPLRRGG